jgi:hypothetical protein
MKLKLTAVLAAWICFALSPAYAQTPNRSIGGKITDESKAPLGFATVALLKAADSTLVKAAFTEAEGLYSFSGLDSGSFRLRVTALGYDTYYSELLKTERNDTLIRVPDITMIAGSQRIGEVAVNAQRNFIERKIDRTVVNVDALISNAGISAMDVLEKSPGVLVDQNGAISLKGKQGVMIYVDDKPTYLSGTDLDNYLRSLPASLLDKIELMPNPPAKYDAAGGAGVINIRTKKNNRKGLNGSVSLGATQGQLFRSSDSFSLNYRNNKFNGFTNMSYSFLHTFADLDIDRRYKNADESTASYFAQNSYIHRKSHNFNGKAGFDYYQSDKTTWGMVFTGASRDARNTNDNVSSLLNASAGLDSLIRAYSREDGTTRNIGGNFNIRHEFKPGGPEITFDADIITYAMGSTQAFDNRSFAADTLRSQDRLNGSLPSYIDIYSLKTDYSQALPQGWKLASGLKTSYTRTSNTAEYSITANGVTQPEYSKSNRFIYKESMNAAYLNLNKDWQLISVQAGLRAEQTISDGHQLGNLVTPDSAFRRSYTSLFPTLYLSYKPDSLSSHQFGLNYGRRINRPYYQDLNPFVSPLDKFTYYVGNPFLDPSFAQSVELSHTYKERFTTTLLYSRSRDDIGETIEIVNGTYYSRPANLGKVEVKSISFDGTFDPLKWLNVNLYSELTEIHSRSDFYTGMLDTRGTFWYISSNMRFTLGKDWSAELSCMYRSKIHDAQFVLSSQGYVNAGIQKKLSPASTLKLSVVDIFYTRINRGIINNLYRTDASYRNRGDSRACILSYSYRFGKSTGSQRRQQGGAESEQNRVKN